MLLCYCTDEVKDKTLFSAWEIRPYPEKWKELSTTT
jgi:hypothetical protein